MTDDAGRVLLATADPLLVAEVARLAAAAGAGLVVEKEPGPALRWWSAAAVVLLGPDAVAGIAAARPPRRDRVLLLGAGLPDTIFRSALACGAEGVVQLPEEEAWLVRLLTDVGDGIPAPALILGVVGGAGGVGASTFSAALGLTVATHRSTVLLDADVLGAGADQILGLDPESGLRWDALLDSTGRLSGRAVRDALPRCGGLSVLAWPVARAPVRDAPAAQEVLSAAARGFSVVVIDLPRHRDLIATEFLPRCDQVLVVTTTTIPSLAATARTVAGLDGSEVGIVVRKRPGGLDPEQAGRFLGRRVVAAMAEQRGLDEDVGLGVGPLRRRRGPLARAALAAAGDVLGRSR